MWATEDFTRIIIGHFEFATPESLDFVVSFQPMKPTYENRNQLKSLVLPIIQKEWNFTSRMYGLNNTAVGEIQLVQLIEDFVDEENSTLVHSFAISLALLCENKVFKLISVFINVNNFYHYNFFTIEDDNLAIIFVESH